MGRQSKYGGQGVCVHACNVVLAGTHEECTFMFGVKQDKSLHVGSKDEVMLWSYGQVTAVATSFYL